MKVVSLLAFALALSASQLMASADGALENKTIQSLVKSEKVGKATVFRDGKSVLRSARKCALLTADIASESFERDSLNICLSGKALDNDYGINPHGYTVGGETLWEGPIFYDPTTKENKVDVKGAEIAFEYCVAKSGGAFAGSCDGKNNDYSKRIAIFPKKVELTLTRWKNGKPTEESKVVCSF